VYAEEEQQVLSPSLIEKPIRERSHEEKPLSRHSEPKPAKKIKLNE
jgi:hypothetical protein